MAQVAWQSDVATPLEPPTPRPTDPLQDLLIVLWLLPPDLHASGSVKEICTRLGFNSESILIETSAVGGVITDTASGISREFVLSNRPAASSQILHEYAIRLSGLLLGTSFACAAVRRIVDLRQALALTPHDCIRLIHIAWPNIKHAGYWAEWRQSLDQLLNALPIDGAVPDRIAVFRWLGTCNRWLGALSQSAGFVEEALELAARVLDGVSYAHLLVDQAILQRYYRHHLSAQATLRAALAEFEQRQDQFGITRTRVELAQTAHEAGDYQEAIHLLAGLPETPRTLALAAEAHLSVGHHVVALDYAQRSVAGSWYDRSNIGRAHATLGRVRLLLGDLQGADIELALALDLQQSSHDVLGYARTQAVRGRVLTLMRQFRSAEDILLTGLAQQENMTDRAGMVGTLNTILELYAVLATEALACGDTATANHAAQQIRVHRRALDCLVGSTS